MLQRTPRVDRYIDEIRPALARALHEVGYNYINLRSTIPGLSEAKLRQVITSLRQAGVLHRSVSLPCVPGRTLGGMVQDLVLLREIEGSDFCLSQIECRITRPGGGISLYYEVLPYPTNTGTSVIKRFSLPDVGDDHQVDWCGWFRCSAHFLMMAKGYHEALSPSSLGYQARMVYARH